MIVIKKGEIFRCWNCDKIVVENVRNDIHIDDKIREMWRKCSLHTSSDARLRREGATIRDNITKCNFCKALIYDNIVKVNFLPDELFEI